MTPTKSTFNIGSISGDQVQIGEHNLICWQNISITELAGCRSTGDVQAKSVLKQLLETKYPLPALLGQASALIGLT